MRFLERRFTAAGVFAAAITAALFAGATDAIESFGFSPDGRRATVSGVDWLSGLTIAEPVAGFVPPRRRK